MKPASEKRMRAWSRTRFWNIQLANSGSAPSPDRSNDCPAAAEFYGIISCMNNCCIFAGQGAQVPGMGMDFAEADADAMALFDKANAVLGFDLKKICFEGPAEELTKSNVCQPAIFVTSYAAYLCS